MSHETVTGLNTLKSGSDPPLRPDAELPEWLWELAAPAKTLNELKRMQEEELTSEEVRGAWGGGGVGVCMPAGTA